MKTQPLYLVNPKSVVDSTHKTASEKLMQEALPEAIKQLRQQIDDDIFALAKEASNRKALI